MQNLVSHSVLHHAARSKAEVFPGNNVSHTVEKIELPNTRYLPACRIVFMATEALEGHLRDEGL